jgi:two-component system response regulator HydG
VGDNKSISVDIRLIAATNQDLQTAINEKRFRQDLYYRLAVARFRIPPLRERPEDIPLLVEHFINKYSKKMDRPVRLGKGALERLTAYNFPGNVRELENLMEQGVALTVGGEMQIVDLLEPGDGGIPDNQTLEDIVSAAERQAIRAALVHNDTTDQAAETLGLSPTTLWRKMKKLNIDNPHRRR